MRVGCQQQTPGVSQNNGYVPFYIEAGRFLKYGAENEILVSVHVANGARWYSGAGIYRDVYLCTADSVHIQPNSLRVETVYAPSCSDPQTRNGRDLAEACIRVHTLVKNEGAAQKTVRVHVRLLDAAGCCAAEGTVPLTLRRGECAYSDQKLSVSDPKLWGCDTPYLYTCQATVSELGAVIVHADGSYERGADRLLDADDVCFGIRTFTLSPQRGLTMNGMPLKLKGAGMHHENGPAGAITLDSIEERKIRMLKNAGFNAVRTAHTPPSPAFLRACDKYGMLVMLELFDTWGHERVCFDNTLTFQNTWETDMEAVVSMAYCHPSVLMYSVGNEIADTGSANGAVVGRAITQKLRALDPTRYTINCINGMVSVMGIIEQLWVNSKENVDQGGQDAINGMMNNLADTFASIMQLPVVGDATEEACAYIAAFRPENYGKVPIQSPWAWSDTVGSWSFEGREGKPVQLEVYADAEEVELFLNGKSAGKAIITEKDRYKAAFELLWQPGTIEAVAYRSGTVCGRCALTSAAGAPSLSVEPECAEVSFRQRDVIFVPIRAAGENGQTLLQRKDTVSVCIDGPAELLGFGSDDPVTEEGFTAPQHRLYDGRALLLLRPTSTGQITVTAASQTLPAASASITVRE